MVLLYAVHALEKIKDTNISEMEISETLIQQFCTTAPLLIQRRTQGSLFQLPLVL